jgi:hypothetical protein
MWRQPPSAVGRESETEILERPELTVVRMTYGLVRDALACTRLESGSLPLV